MDDRSSPEAVAQVAGELLEDLGPVEKVTAVPKGHGHECWRVQGGVREVMLKLALRGATAVSMDNLAEALRLAEQGGVPSPRLLWSGTAPPLLASRPMLIQEYLPGIDGEEALATLDAAALGRYYRDWGSAVGRLHSVAPEGFSTSISQPERFHPTWLSLVEERLARMVALNREAGVITDGLLDRAASEILRGARRLGPTVRPGLIHGDLYPPNTLVDDARFTAILDFEHAKAWDPVHDFVKLRMWTFERHQGSERPFLDGYRGTAPAIEGFEDRLRVCAGLELLAGFPYWKKLGEDQMQKDYLGRFDRWLGRSQPA